MKLKIPDNPTPEQAKAMTLALIRNTFEPDATDIDAIEPFEDDGWRTTYTASGQKFQISYTPKDGFVKGPIATAEFRDYTRDRLGRFANTAAHAGEHLAENVIAWKTGKVVGGAVAAIASSHGINPDAARVISESAVQALTATAIYARKEKASGGDIAKKFIAESAAALAGKLSHIGVDDALLGGDDHVREIAALFAGKTAGIGTNAAVGKFLDKHGKRLKALIERRDDFSDYDFSAGDDSGLTQAEQETLFDLAIAGLFTLGNSSQFAESDTLTDAEWDALAEAVADPEQQPEIVAEAMQTLADLTD